MFKKYIIKKYYTYVLFAIFMTTFLTSCCSIRIGNKNTAKKVAEKQDNFHAKVCNIMDHFSPRSKEENFTE